MTKICAEKFLCYFCCVLLIFLSIPTTGAQGADSGDGIFYIISGHPTHRFSAYMPHSLNQAKMPDRCVWLKNADTNIGTDPCREFVQDQRIDLQSADNIYSLHKSVFDNHLNHCKREVYHLLI